MLGRENDLCGFFVLFTNVNALLVYLLFFLLCVFRYVSHSFGSYSCDFRRVIISDQLACEPLCDNLVESRGHLVTLLLFGSILHELSCIEPVPGSPLKLSTSYSSSSRKKLNAHLLQVPDCFFLFLVLLGFDQSYALDIKKKGKRQLLKHPSSVV